MVQGWNLNRTKFSLFFAKARVVSFWVLSLVFIFLNNLDHAAAEDIQSDCVRNAVEQFKFCANGLGQGEEIKSLLTEQVKNAGIGTEYNQNALKGLDTQNKASIVGNVQIGGCEQAAKECESKKCENDKDLQEHCSLSTDYKGCIDTGKAPREKEKENFCNLIKRITVDLSASNSTLVQAINQSALAADQSGSKVQDALLYGGIGAAAGGLLGYMFGSDEKEKDKTPPPANNTNDPNMSQLDKCLAQDMAKPATECMDPLKTFCLANVQDEKCKTFSSTYCNDETKQGQMSDPYCHAVRIANFCLNSSNVSCPSCAEMALKNSPACQNNPSSACFHEDLNASTISQQMKSCPTDPKWSDPKYIAIVNGQNMGPEALASTNNTSNNGTTSNSGDLLPVGDNNKATTTAANQPTQGSGIIGSAGGGSVGGNNGSNTASQTGTNKPLPGDVGGSFQTGLFQTVSQSVQQNCQANLVSNCGIYAQHEKDKPDRDTASKSTAGAN